MLDVSICLWVWMCLYICMLVWSGYDVNAFHIWFMLCLDMPVYLYSPKLWNICILVWSGYDVVDFHVWMCLYTCILRSYGILVCLHDQAMRSLILYLGMPVCFCSSKFWNAYIRVWLSHMIYMYAQSIVDGPIFMYFQVGDWNMYIYSQLLSMILLVYVYLCLLLSTTKRFQNRSIMVMVAVTTHFFFKTNQ